MADFINLECPHCGASLKVGKDLIHAKCPYCTQEVLIKVNDGHILEAHNQCPICHRNDRTKKVSSIMTSTGENRAFFAIPSKPIRPKAAHIPPPPQPPIEEFINSNNNVLKLLYVFGGLAILSLLCAISDPSNNSSGFLFLLIFGGAAFYFYKRHQNEKQKEDHTQFDYQGKLSDYQTQVSNHHKAIEEQNKSQEELYRTWIENWEAAVEKWKKLYYCERDDCVFIPGSESTAPLKDIEQYCYQRD